MTNWSNDRELEFLEVYQAEPVLWDPEHRHYKDRNEVHSAWTRISEELNIPIANLKKKKESLMATFRMHRRKAKASGADDSYNPTWFAYELMNSYLGKSSMSRTATNTTDSEEIDDVGVKAERAEPTIRRRRNPPELAEVGHSGHSEVLYQHGDLSQQREDECDLYGRLLASKLRKLPEHERLNFMHEIDGLFIQRFADQWTSRSGTGKIIADEYLNTNNKNPVGLHSKGVDDQNDPMNSIHYST